MRFRIPLATAWAIAAAPALAQIDGIGPVGEIEKVQGGFQFTEGPAWDGKGTLYFSDIPANRIYQYRPDAEGEKVSVLLEPSGHTNGLMVGGDGLIHACSMDGQLIAVDPETKKVSLLAEVHDGKRFNAPNDLVLEKAGGVYFTDPAFRAPVPLP